MFDISTMTIWSLPIKESHSDRNIPQIWAVYSKNYTNKTFDYLKKMNSSRNSVVFFTSVIEKKFLYVDIAKENIRYGKFLYDAQYKKLVKSI